MTSPKLTNLRNIHIISEMALNGTAEYQAFGSRPLRKKTPNWLIISKLGVFIFG